MKKTLFAVLLLSIGSITGYAQCARQVILTSSKTEYLDSNGALQKTEEEKSVVEINKSEIIITPGNEDHKMTGIIKSDTCNWKTPFKEGKTVIKATLSRDGNTMNATITIEGKDGKITLLFEVEERPDRKIRIVADKFEEKK
ncbi:MAG: hypothetical protein H7122_20860 [Chitinophagaceae bacterium]|nr:hypothetical protein [Chitinophagaceae bacterium]